MESLTALIKHFWPTVTPDFEVALKEAVVREEIAKKTVILQEGQVAKKMYFVEKGCLRGYYLKEGAEVNSWFMKEDDFVISIVSFYTQQPSEELIETLEDCVLWSISYQRLHQLYLQHLTKLGGC